MPSPKPLSDAWFAALKRQLTKTKEVRKSIEEWKKLSPQPILIDYLRNKFPDLDADTMALVIIQLKNSK